MDSLTYKTDKSNSSADADIIKLGFNSYNYREKKLWPTKKKFIQCAPGLKYYKFPHRSHLVQPYNTSKYFEFLNGFHTAPPALDVEITS